MRRKKIKDFVLNYENINPEEKGFRDLSIISILKRKKS